ncbi:hypothetical protein IT398_00010 [Candidatus Nomurabacteria bacterium]|nr:hypothetical protein [Candidatus Nomurabacteria bacterium]
MAKKEGIEPKFLESLEKKSLPIHKKIREQIEESMQVFNKLGVEESVNKIYESLNPILKKLSSKEELAPSITPLSMEESMRHIIREELEYLIKKDEEQIVLEIDSKNYVGFDDNKFELNSGGIDILRILSEYNQYLAVKHILEKSGSHHTDGSLRKGIASVNRKMKINLKLENKVILGKRGSGYIINPLYKIRFKK